VRHVADRVAVMYLGRIIEIAPRDDFFAAPAHPYSEALLSSVPRLDPGPARERIVLDGELPDPAAPPQGCSYHTRCRIAVDKCRTVEPPLAEIRPGRSVRCHLPLVPLESR
jgi:oligopeptide transport system ATP-binding protein